MSPHRLSRRIFRPSRRLLSALAVAGASLGPLQAAETPAPGAAAMADHAQTCRHYDNRARFLPRGEHPPFLAMLADSCLMALDMAQGRRPASAEQAAGAAAYLEKLTRLRTEIVRINRSRVYGAEDQAYPLARTRMGAAVTMATVTPYGEYLIAHSMGVLRAMDAWQETGVDVAGR